MDLPFGWSLWADPIGEYGVTPKFRNEAGAHRTPMEVAEQTDAYRAHAIFRAVKQWLDEADLQQGRAIEITWKAADIAKLALQLCLERVGRWEASLLETEVTARG